MYPERTWKEILTIISGKNQKEVENPNGKYPIYGSGGIIGYANESLCPAHTVIIGRKGTIDKPIFVTEPFWNIDTAFGIVAGKEVLPKFLYYFCRIFNFKSLDKSTGRPSLAKTDLLKIKMPLPDLEEQARIVARIEELFSQLESGVETLKQTKAQLAVYRQAVLKEAFDSIDAGSFVPFRNIFIGSPQNGIYKPASSYGSGTRILRIDGFYSGSILSDYDYKRVKLTDDEIQKYELSVGDIVINRVNSMPYLGKCALVRSLSEKTVFESNMMKIQIDTSLVDSEFLVCYLASRYGKSELTKNAKQAVNQASINQTDVGNAMIPLPLMETQLELRSIIQERLSVCDQIEQTVDAALQQAEALRQSILKKAFEGGL